MSEFLGPLPLAEQVAAKILGRQAETIGSRTFVAFGASTITYREANARANRVADAFRALGATKGTRVGILLRNRLEYLDLWFGLSKIGAIQVPINTEYKSRQILHVLRRAPVSFVVVEESLAGELLAVIDQVPEVQALINVGSTMALGERRKQKVLSYTECIEAAGAEEPREAEIAGSDIGAIMNTSGTTGPSKGVQLSHAQQYILGRNIALDLGLTERDVYYNFFPLFHNTAQAMITLPVLLTGAKMVLAEKFSATRFWPDVREHGCTTFYYIGEILRILLKSTSAEDSKGTTLRAGWGIGASPKDFLEFQKRHGVALRAGYGSTEANVPVYLPHENPDPASVGRAVRGFEIRIANEHDEPLPPGQMGEILVRSAEPCAIMLGYDGDAQATIAAWRDLWFHTGDAGYLDTEGNLYFMGRVRDVIRVRGENVSAFEVEEAIAEVNGVLEVAAIGVPCELGGDDVKIVVVASPDTKPDAAALIAHAQSRLPKFAVPRYVEFVAALPKTETNKVRKNVLRATPLGPATWDRLAGSK
ncbi:MAG: AMP-binding protein [Betaproteobacteria bacterium]|nr:AMP-binding protein [Betaproteobacteria bacterium]